MRNVQELIMCIMEILSKYKLWQGVEIKDNKIMCCSLDLSFFYECCKEMKYKKIDYIVKQIKEPENKDLIISFLFEDIFEKVIKHWAVLSKFEELARKNNCQMKIDKKKHAIILSKNKK